MSAEARVFVDTNVLVYSRDSSEAEKQPAADLWMTRLWELRTGRVSRQVLHEYYVTVTRKLDPGLDPAAARSDVRDLEAWAPLPPSLELDEEAWKAQDRYGLSFWDALIVAAGRLSGCAWLLTEDLQHRQDYGGVVAIDPFRTAPEDVLGAP